MVKDQLEGLVSQMVERGILFNEAICEFEKRFIKRVLDRANGNQSRAAELLGIHRNTLSRKIDEYKLESPAFALESLRAGSIRRVQNGSPKSLESRFLDAVDIREV
jgi:Fis family transcriptional regulator, factor for inversion stimulation protein